MDIKHVFEDSRIVMLEEDIARINEHCRYSDNEKLMMKYLLEERYRVLCHLTEYDDEMRRNDSSLISMMHSERLAPNCITERWRSIKNAYNAWITPNTLKWKERYSLVTNILHSTLFRQKRQSRCGMPSHVVDFVRSMTMAAHGLSVSAESVHQSITDMRLW